MSGMTVCPVLAKHLYKRASHRSCSVRKGVLRSFTKFTGKHLCQSLFFNKVDSVLVKFYIKKGTLTQAFSCEFAKFLRTPFLKNTSGRLPLYVKENTCSSQKSQQSWTIYRSSRPEVFCKKGVLRNLTKFTGKHLCQSPFFNIKLY